MSFDKCLMEARKEASVPADLAKDAERFWNKKRQEYSDAGDPWHIADEKAAEDAKAFLFQYAAMNRHTKQAQLANMAKLQKDVAAADDLSKLPTRTMEVLDMRSRALKRRFDGKMKEYLAANHRDILGRDTDKATLEAVVRELHGEKTGNKHAAALSDGIRYAMEDMRLMFNEAGGVIGKLDNWGLPHTHSRAQILRAGIKRLADERGVSTARIKADLANPLKGSKTHQAVFEQSFEQWFGDIEGRIDWSKMTDYETGRPFQGEGGSAPSPERQRDFLRGIFDTIAYGERANEPSYGKTAGHALYKAHGQHRVLQFKSADDWIAYNKEYGSGDPHNALMAHVHRMAKDIVAMREFGPSPQLGQDFQGQLVLAEAKKRDLSPMLVESRIKHAERMMRVERGGEPASGYWGSMSATFFADTRRVLSGALLERASIASLSDLNSMNLAAQSIGANPRNAISSYVNTVKAMVSEGTLTTDEMLQMQWVADTMADPGVASARFEAELPSSEWAERTSNFVMRASGLSSHTDAARFALQKTFGAHLANQVGKGFDALDDGLLKVLKENGISEVDWADFANGQNLFVAGNGAKFLDPLYWRSATDMDAARADELLLKFQGAAEDFIELGVPTQSLFMRGALDPAAWGLMPGSAPYEVMKSTLMFKSFVMSFSFNQYRILQRLPSGQARAAHLARLVAGATAIGAVSVQLTELVKGNDVMPMDNKTFWAKAMMKGGGLAILGDILVAGESSWGGGFGSFLTGPMVQLADDTWDLTMSNLIAAGGQVLRGEEVDTGFVKELAKYGSRYTPAKDLPFMGPAIDRMIFDQMQIMLDPESIDAMHRKSQKRQNLYGNGSWWMPGSPTPNRAPKLVPEFDPAELFKL